MSAAARSNPRRRQRNSSDDSVAIRQPVKRRKRSALTNETFQSPNGSSQNGTTSQDQRHSLANDSPSDLQDAEERDVVDATTLAFRGKATRRHDEAAAHRRQTTSEILVRDILVSRTHVDCHFSNKLQTNTDYYLINLLDGTPDALDDQNQPAAWNAALYPQFGYAVAATHREAIIWPYKQQSSLSGKPHCTRVRLPLTTSKKNQALPLARIVKFSAELSLLVVNPNDGAIIFWESMIEAATVDPNRQRQQSVHGNVGSMFSNETVTDVTEAESRGFVLTLSSGRLAHLSLGDNQGKTNIKTEFMRSSANQTSGIFGSLRGVFSGSGWKPIAAVRASDSTHRGQRHVITATSSGTFQVWDMNWNGSHTLDYEINTRAEIAAALREGSHALPAVVNPDFELLDFTLPSYDSDQGLTLAKSQEKNFYAIALTAVRESDSASYAVVGINISKVQSQVDTVRSIKCFTESLMSPIHFRPSILVPKPGHAAIITFESTIVIMSLEQDEPNPSSQLKREAHEIPDPFEDLIQFQKDKLFRVVGSSVDSPISSQKSSTCIIAVQHAGLIRVVVRPLKKDHAPVNRSAVTTRGKLEQAVFFSDARQNFLDFSSQEGDNVSAEEVEQAALDISRAITDSSSHYLTAVNPSMESQLANRAAKLKNLINQVQGTFGPIQTIARWRLLWDAEKVAAAQSLWHWYNETPVTADERKSIFAEMVEAIPETLKVENQPDHGETDGVRHWFVHDIWRLEWIIPYSHEIVEILFKESNEDDQEFDENTRARMISIAAEMQLITLETAFRFRETNSKAYGFDATLLDHGILKSPELFQSLPEFWTSSRLGGKQGLIPTRLKEIADAAREMAKNLVVLVDELMEQQEDPKSPEERPNMDQEEVFAVMQLLARKCPRQIDVCEKVYKEHGYWLLAQADEKLREQGRVIKYGYPKLRRKQLVDLADIGLAEEAIGLAENHGDMEALLDILESENMESNSIGPSIPRRVKSYFQRFGERWADAYFSRNLSKGQQAGEVLKSTEFKPYLTSFLRRNPDYASLKWINEVSSERDYSRAAHALFEASQQTRDVWPQKIMLSLGKLSLLAAQSKDPSGSLPSALDAKKTDYTIDALQLQEDLFDALKPYVKSAIDDDAAVDVVMDHHGIQIIDQTPYLARQARSCLEKVLSHQTVPPSDIADLLSLLHEDTVQSEASTFISQRFLLALRCVQLQSTILDLATDSSKLAPVFKAVWRRLLIASDWTVLSRTEKKSDAEVSQEIKETILYQTLAEGFRFRSKLDGSSFWELLPPPASPHDLLDKGEQSQILQQQCEAKGEVESKNPSKLARDIASEDEKLQRYIDKGRLEEWYHGVMEAAQNAVRDEQTLKDRFKKQKSGELDWKVEKARAPDVDAHDDVNGSG